MCLAIPGKVVSFHHNCGVRMSKVDFGGIAREACLEYLPDTKLGDYVLVHVGFAISKVDEEEAARTYAYLSGMDQPGSRRGGGVRSGSRSTKRREGQVRHAGVAGLVEDGSGDGGVARVPDREVWGLALV